MCVWWGITNRAIAIKLLINDYKKYNFLLYLANRSYVSFKIT